jgi:hypothetical protein
VAEAPPARGHCRGVACRGFLDAALRPTHAVRTASPVAAVPQSTADTAAVSAAAGRAADTLVRGTGGVEVPLPHAAACAHCRWRVGMHGRSATGEAAVSSPCSGLRPCPWWTAAIGRDPAAVSGSGHLLGSRPGSAQPADIDGPDEWTGSRLVDTGSPQVPGAADPPTAAGSSGHCGNATLDSRQQQRPPPPQGPTSNGTARCGIGQHRHGLIARSVVWGGRKASVVLARQRRLGKPAVKVRAGRARQNVDRIVDRAEQALGLRAPDSDLVL